MARVVLYATQRTQLSCRKTVCTVWVDTRLVKLFALRHVYPIRSVCACNFLCAFRCDKTVVSQKFQNYTFTALHDGHNYSLPAGSTWLLSR
jgi:hypothetical protein